MFRLVFVALALVCAAGKSSGVKWVELTAGDPLPPGTTPFPQSAAIVGRARHFNDILPAQVWPNSTATIKVCNKRLTKQAFAVLTSEKPCYWQRFQRSESLPEDLVLVGHENATKPLFLSSRGGYNSYSSSDPVYVFSLSPNDLNTVTSNGYSVLVCPTERVWLDVSARKVPNATVSAGKSTGGHEMFVARLKNQCSVYPGQVTPKTGLATAWIGDRKIEARYSQVLIGDFDQYSWVPIDEDVFPDNAVVGSSDSSYLYYVAKDLAKNRVTYVVSVFKKGSYEILIENPRQLMPELSTALPETMRNLIRFDEDYSF